MTTYNGYEYNEFGVCLNPDIPYEFGVYNKAHFEIKLSETPNGWTYGYYYSYDLTGGCGGCNLNGEIYPSRSKAIIDCAERLKTMLSKAKLFKAAIAELDRIIAEESGKKPHLKQYSIFDYLND